MRFLLRLLITAATLWVATRLVGGITFTGSAVALIGVAFVFGIVNAFIGGILRVLGLPFVILTLGFFLLVINAILLLITSRLSSAFGLGFHVSGFGAAFWGGIVISLVGMVLNAVLRDAIDDDEG